MPPVHTTDRERRSFNRKRRIAEPGASDELDRLAAQVRYSGNPRHKRNPGDFALNPPADPAGDNTLCDIAGVFTRKEAQRLLQEGVKRGLVSVQRRDGLPQNVWAVSDDGYPLEAQLEGRGQITYHGYPVPQNDPLRTDILDRWDQR